MTRARTTSSSRRSLWRTSNGDIDLHYRNWADWAPAEGSRDGQTEFEWTDHKFQRFADALASRREELGEQMNELALQEGSQDDEHTVTAESEENQTEPDVEHDESDKGSPIGVARVLTQDSSAGS